MTAGGIPMVGLPVSKKPRLNGRGNLQRASSGQTLDGAPRPSIPVSRCAATRASPAAPSLGLRPRSVGRFATIGALPSVRGEAPVEAHALARAIENGDRTTAPHHEQPVDDQCQSGA